MVSVQLLRQTAVVLATAALGAGAAVGAVALLGGFDDPPTVVTETVTQEATDTTRASSGGMSISEIYERASPGVVQVAASSNTQTTVDPQTIDPVDPVLPQAPSAALGSGFVVDKAGHIVTNYHVVQGSSQIRVSFSNRDSVEANVVGTDASTDLAVLKVDTDASALTPLPLGNSDTVKVGDQVVAIGNPFGLDRTATAGIVSALQRFITAPNQFTIDHVIQTDAPINRGNSGGPLLNDRGQVIGVNTQIQTGGVAQGNVGIGFAVPSKTVKEVVAQILRTGRVDRAWLGIRGQELSSEVVGTFNLPVQEGILVRSVSVGSGAEKAGLKGGETQVVVAGETYVLGGDIIVSLDGAKTATIADLRDAIARHKPGDRVRLEIFRDGKKTSVNVTLGRQPSSPQG